MVLKMLHESSKKIKFEVESKYYPSCETTKYHKG
jgi:hypothetical protein